MSDVLLVCVGADAATAEALAEVCETAGFSISEDAVSAESVARNHVCLIVWSRVAMDSPAFNSAMAEAISAQKAVIACVSAPDDIALTAPTFDISTWSRDPDDAVLDDLFDAVDRMSPASEPAETVGLASEPEPVVRLVSETPAPVVADRANAKTKPACRKRREARAEPEFDPMRIGRDKPYLRLVHGVLAVLLMSGFAFANLAPARSAEPTGQAVAQIPDETASLIPGAQNFTMDELLSDRPLPPMPELAEGIGPVALASLDSYDVAPVQPLRPRRARVHLAAAEAAPTSIASESDKIEAAATYVVAAPSAAVTLTPAAFMAAPEGDKPDGKPHV